MPKIRISEAVEALEFVKLLVVMIVVGVAVGMEV